MKTGISESIERQKAEKRKKAKKEYDTKKRIIKELNRSKEEKKKLRERAQQIYEDKKKAIERQKKIIKKTVSRRKVNFNIKPKKRKQKKTKSDINAKKIEKIQKKAREKIREMESVGFTVPQPLKDLSKRKLPATQQMYEDIKRLLNISQVKRSSYLLIDSIRSGTHPQGMILDDPVRGIDYSVLTDKKRLAKKLNDMRTVKVPKRAPNKGESEDKYFGHVRSALEGADIDNIAQALGKETKPGEDNEYFSIDDTWDGQLFSLAEHITWKQVPVDQFWKDDHGEKYNEVIESIVRYMGLAYTDRKLYDEFRESVDSQNWERFKKKYSDKNDDADTDTLEMLAYILNSSHLWHIASRYIPPSEAAEIVHDQLVDIVIKASKEGESIMSEIVAMIRAEKDLEDIREKFDELIKIKYSESQE